ncbi:MAG: hypothetical protein Q9174_002106 [Haloplaca sp. 1 TL-2023]
MTNGEEPERQPHPVDVVSGSDSEDDSISGEIRDSTDLAEHDRQFLLDEEEREDLLTEKQSIGHRSFFRRKKQDKLRHPNRQTSARRSRRSRRSKRRHGPNDEAGELLYEMEEGGVKDDTSSQASSSSTEVNKPNQWSSQTTKKKKLLLQLGLGSAVLLICILLIFGTYKVSQSSKKSNILAILSNGTAEFAPTTILISLDGFRADFLRRGLTPTLNSFVAQGVSPSYMLPSFPSVTFPNHYTLVTGLHPESHGVVGNTFWDPALDEDFYYTDPTRSMQPKWWADGEPLWVTAEKQNVTTAIHMWPGSEAHIKSLEPTFLDKFNGTEDLTRKANRILQLLDTSGPVLAPAIASRPQLIAAYVPNVDADGHLYGPNSTEIRDTIQSVDNMLHHLFTGLEQRNLAEIVNVVVVSDHGMATTSTDRLVQLDDLIDLDLVDRIDGWPLYGLRPKNSADLRGLYDKLLAEAKQNDHFDVYTKETMPERYHFSNNDRIAPLWVIPKTGWAIVHKEDFDIKEAKSKGQVYHPKGLHGYDHEHPLMRSIFIARGPAFPHQPNSRLEVFRKSIDPTRSADRFADWLFLTSENIEVYNIVCDSIGIEPRPNNGTLRLPLKPIGVHTEQPSDDLPLDQGPNDTEAETSPESGAAPAKEPSAASSNDGIAENADDKADQGHSYWNFLKSKFEAAKSWADDVIAKLGGA